MSLTVSQKSQIRRHLKYSVVPFSTAASVGGGGTLGTNQNILATSYLNFLEQQLNALQPCDEAQLVGKACGSVVFLGKPALGDTVSLTFQDVALVHSPYTLVVTATAAEVGSLDNFGLLVARKVSQDATLSAYGYQALTPMGPGSNVLNANVEASITNAKAFTLAVASTGAISAVITDDGSLLPEPSAQVGKAQGIPVILHGYLPILNYLYGAIASATTRQGTLQADVFKARQDEVSARTKLYELYQNDLATFLGVPINGKAAGGSRNYGQITI